MTDVTRCALAASLVAALTACGPLPVRPVVVVPAVRAVGALVRRQAGPGIAGAVCRLQDSTGWVTATSTAPDGYLLWTPVLASLRATQVECAAEGYLPLSESRVLATGQNENLAPLVLRPSFVPLPRLVAEGQHFRQADGGRFTTVEASDFNLLNRWQHGEDIEPILTQRHDAGFNMLRVWTLMRLAQYGIGDFIDIAYARVPAFLARCERDGFYVELTAYTSTWDPQHWDRLITATRDSRNVLLSLSNEADQPANALPVPLSSFACAQTVLSSRGSNGSEQWPPTPYCQYTEFHSNGASEEQRKVGHNAWEITNSLPVLTTETSRYPDVGMWRGASIDRAKQVACDSAAGAALLAAGSTFHSVAGKASLLWDRDTQVVAAEWARCARSVDLSQQDAPYQHRIDLEGPNDLRVYQRGTSIVRIRR